MNCPACTKPIPEGFLLLCPACFNSLPKARQHNFRAHVTRVGKTNLKAIQPMLDSLVKHLQEKAIDDLFDRSEHPPKTT